MSALVVGKIPNLGIVEPIRRHLPVISNSEVKTFKRCPREHHFAYRLLRRAIRRANALALGSLYHAGLETWWRGGGDLIAALAAIDAFDDAAIDIFDRAKARAMMRMYHARWAGADYEVLAVEELWTADLINPETGAASRTFRVSGKIDGLIRRLSDNTIWIVESKTTSEDIGVGSDYWKRLKIDSQVSTYLMGVADIMARLGIEGEPAGVLYDVTRKPGQRPLEVNKKNKEAETPEDYEHRCLEAMGENPDRFLQRGEVVRLEEDALDAAHDLWSYARLMREAEIAKRYPRNVDQCNRFGRTCEYFGVCTGEARLDDDSMFRTAETGHEELASA